MVFCPSPVCPSPVCPSPVCPSPVCPSPVKRVPIFDLEARHRAGAQDSISKGPNFGTGRGRRHIVHFNATFHPTSAWVIQQLREAFPYDTAPRYLIFDRDFIFNAAVIEFIKAVDCTIDTSGERQPESAWSLALLGWSPRSSSSASSLAR